MQNPTPGILQTCTPCESPLWGSCTGCLSTLIQRSDGKRCDSTLTSTFGFPLRWVSAASWDQCPAQRVWAQSWDTARTGTEAALATARLLLELWITLRATGNFTFTCMLCKANTPILKGFIRLNTLLPLEKKWSDFVVVLNYEAVWKGRYSTQLQKKECA